MWRWEHASKWQQARSPSESFSISRENRESQERVHQGWRGQVIEVSLSLDFQTLVGFELGSDRTDVCFKSVENKLEGNKTEGKVINWEAITVGLDWGGRLWVEKADAFESD